MFDDDLQSRQPTDSFLHPLQHFEGQAAGVVPGDSADDAQTFRVDGHPVVRSLALAMVQTDYPRKLTVSIAEFLRTMLTA